jgi:hypothetical protein
MLGATRATMGERHRSSIPPQLQIVLEQDAPSIFDVGRGLSILTSVTCSVSMSLDGGLAPRYLAI